VVFDISETAFETAFEVRSLNFSLFKLRAVGVKGAENYI
jgi:hypothetical protein